MPLDAIATTLADAAFAPTAPRHVVAWESSPDSIFITGRLKGTRKRGIVSVNRTKDRYTLGVKGPRNIIFHLDMAEHDLANPAITGFATGAVAEIIAVLRRPARFLVR